MSAKRLEAHYDDRVYYFQLVSKDEKTITVDMYNTPYTFVRAGEKWENHPSNRNNMVSGLITAVIKTLQIR